MTRRLNLSRFSLVCLSLLVSISPLAAQPTGQRAMLRVRLPADALLRVEGQPTRQTGPRRSFSTPPLMSGKNYLYDFEWTFRKDGKTYRGTKSIRIRAGEDREVDLTAETVAEIDSERSGSSDDDKSDKGDGEKHPKLTVPFEATPQDVVDRMLEAARITEKDVVYDLGCGDGRIVATAARKYGCKAVGFDLDPKRVRQSRQTVKANGIEKLVTIEQKDFFEVDLQPATVVTLYLLPDVNVQLIPQLEKLKKGAIILSHDFAIKGVEPANKITMRSREDKKIHTIYVWFAPIKKKE